MDGNVVALLAAVVGVLGTLTSPVISQRLSARTKREELEAQRADALAVRELARREALERDKKAAYVGFNAASRRYRVEMMNYLHALDAGTAGEVDRVELREARRAYSLSVADLQIMASDRVLEAAEQVTGRLRDAFVAVKRIEDGTPLPGWSFEETRQYLMDAWDHWLSMRRVMRSDLGLDAGEFTAARP